MIINRAYKKIMYIVLLYSQYEIIMKVKMMINDNAIRLIAVLNSGNIQIISGLYSLFATPDYYCSSKNRRYEKKKN